MSKSVIISSKSKTFINKELNQLFKELGIDKNNEVDILRVKQKEKQSIGVEEMKDLKSWAVTKPYNSKSKISIIEKAEILTEEAQNSILKLLEEPNSSFNLVLITPNHNFLLNTVLSRCELIRDTSLLEYEVSTFLSLSLDEKFLLIYKMLDDKTKNKTTIRIREFLTNLLYFYRESLINNVNMENVKFNINLIKDTEQMISANVYTKLALENLIINLK
jgi:DNA polymerase-3 subunit delta'